ncbi:hypothetical protein ES705_47350 [subsurface metagenome]
MTGNSFYKIHCFFSLVSCFFIYISYFYSRRMLSPEFSVAFNHLLGYFNISNFITWFYIVIEGHFIIVSLETLYPKSRVNQGITCGKSIFFCSGKNLSRFNKNWQLFTDRFKQDGLSHSRRIFITNF